MMSNLYIRPAQRLSGPYRRNLLIAAIMVLILGEAGARWGLGLGDPPLVMDDPEIEYLFRPGTYHRFGNVVHYNQWSMRSDDFPRERSDPEEIRIMVIGDSVANGGSLIDQREVAATLLQERLRRDLGWKVVVGNISAGGWGPSNALAYVRKYGFFEADLVVLVLSSHDYADAPTFAPRAGKHLDFPDQTPVFALQEVVVRYLPRYLRALESVLRGEESASALADVIDPIAIDQSMEALSDLVALARAGAEVLLVQHLERDEVLGERRPGYAEIKRLAEEMEVDRVDLGPSFAAAIESGRNPYKDIIHPNAEGQRLIADTLIGPIENALTHRIALQQNP